MKRTVWAFLGVYALAFGLWAGLPFAPAGPWLATPPAGVGMAVALTFDDGPNPTYTPQVLRILNEHHAKGTFFLVGHNVARHREAAAQIVRDGHEVGNHSMRHQYVLPFKLPNQISGEFRETQDIIQDATGVRPRLFRAPHGRLSPWMGVAIHRAGAEIVGWDVSPRDWENPPADTLVRRVLAGVRPGSIVLLHDGIDLNERANREVLIQALPRIVEGLQAQGYRLVTVSELLHPLS